MVQLLASLPDSYRMLVMVLETSVEVPEMEAVIKNLLHEEGKSEEKTGGDPEKALASIRWVLKMRMRWSSYWQAFPIPTSTFQIFSNWTKIHTTTHAKEGNPDKH